MTKGSDSTLAIIGGGPRAISILAALSQQLQTSPERVSQQLGHLRILILDPRHPSVGAVWDEGAPTGFRCNALWEDAVFPGTNGQFVSLATGIVREGSGFGPGTRTGRGSAGGFNEVSRGTMGRRLRSIRDQILQDLNQTVSVELLSERVARISRTADRWILETENARRSVGGVLDVTGTGFNGYPVSRGGRPACLQDIGPGERVEVYGLGLGAIDVINALTLDRGGQYRYDDAALKYSRSGLEPCISAGSRSSKIRRPSWPTEGKWTATEIPRATMEAFLRSTDVAGAQQIVEEACELSQTETAGAGPRVKGLSEQLEEVAALDRDEAVAVQSRVARIVEAFAFRGGTLSATHVAALSRVASKYTSGPPLERYAEWQALCEAKVLGFGDHKDWEDRDDSGSETWTIRAFVDPRGLSYASPLGPADSAAIAKTDPQNWRVEGFDGWWVCGHGGNHPVRGDLPRRQSAPQWQLPAELVAADIANFFANAGDGASYKQSRRHN